MVLILFIYQADLDLNDTTGNTSVVAMVTHVVSSRRHGNALVIALNVPATQLQTCDLSVSYVLSRNTLLFKKHFLFRVKFSL